MADVKHSAEDVINAISGSGGVKLMIARRLGVHRHTVDAYLKRYPSAMVAYNDEVEGIGDLAESVIISSIRNNDVATAKWYATMKLKHRGYVERQEFSGNDGGPVQVEQKIIEVVKHYGGGEGGA